MTVKVPVRRKLVWSLSSIVKMDVILVDGSVVCVHPRSNSFRVLALVRDPPPIDLPPATIFLYLCPLDCQVARAPDALRNVRKAMLGVLGPKLAGALLLPSCVGPVFRHGIHEPPVTIAKRSLPISSALFRAELGNHLLDNGAGGTWLPHSDPHPKR